MGREDLAMTTAGFGQMLAFLALLGLIAKALGAYGQPAPVHAFRSASSDDSW
jgi:hypothetical protein